MNDALVIIIMAVFGFSCYAIGWTIGYKSGQYLGYRRGRAVNRHISQLVK